MRKPMLVLAKVTVARLRSVARATRRAATGGRPKARARLGWRFAWALAALVALAAACRETSAPALCAGVPPVTGWTYLGPDSELITTVAITSGGVLASTGSGGVLRYDSCARRWVASGLAGRVISSITALPPPSNRILVTATPPNDSDTISAAIYASDDGRTWYPRDGTLSAQLGYRGYGYSLAFDSADANRLFAGVGNVIVRSTDGGRTWATVFGSVTRMYHVRPVSSFAVSARGTGRVWAGTGSQFYSQVLRSDDGGSTWQRFEPTNVGLPDYVQALVLDPLDDDRLYTGQSSGMWETQDAGVSWRRILAHPGVTAAAMISGELIAVTTEVVPPSWPTTDVLGLYTSVDQGTTWDTLPVPPSARGGTALAISSERVAFIGTYAGVWAVALP